MNIFYNLAPHDECFQKSSFTCYIFIEKPNKKYLKKKLGKTSKENMRILFESWSIPNHVLY